MTNPIVIALVLAASLTISRAEDPDPALTQSRFVTEENITAPTGISVSPNGVVFVSSDPNGTTRQGRKVGKVIRCEDTDGDLLADRFTNFVDGIDSPRGSCFVGDTLYLVQPPLLVAYRDPDGDGVAEENEVLVTGLGQPLRTASALHAANGVQMGIDGWLYLTIGDRGCSLATGTDGSKATIRGGGLLRVRPDGSQLEVLVTGARNLYDLAIDPYLDLFARGNSNDGGGWNTQLHHLIEWADLGYPHLYRNFSQECLPAIADFGAGAGTGMHYLHEPGFPDTISDSLLSGDFNTGVHLHSRKPQEATYQIAQQPFLELPKNTGIDADGNSRLYFSSWAGGGFGFATGRFGHVDLVRAAGGESADPFPELAKARDPELLQHLVARSQVRRLNAMREMVGRGAKAIFSKALRESAADPDLPIYARAAAIMTLKQIDGSRSHPALAELYDFPEIREFVVRALGDVADEIDPTGKVILLKALGDENPRVQLRGIVGLARSGEVSAAAAILPLAKSEKLVRPRPVAPEERSGTAEGTTAGRVIPHVALKAVVKLGAVDLLLGRLESNELREPALRGLQQIHSEPVVSGLASRVNSSNDPGLIKLLTIALFRLYHREAPWDGTSWWGHRPNFEGPYVRCATWEQSPQVKAALQTAFKKADPQDYPELFDHMRLNQVPQDDLELEIDFDEVLSFLDKPSLSHGEFVQVMAAVADKTRPETDALKIYRYFEATPLPDSYINRAHILRTWGEGQAAGELQRKAYADFVSGREFIGRMDELEPFFKNSEKDSYKYAHLQLLNLLNNPSVPKETRDAAAAELEKTWADKKNIYPHRLRGLMLAFEESDPSPYAKQLKPLVDHRDERVKQPAARFLQRIGGSGAKKE